MTVPAGPAWVAEHLKRLMASGIQPHFQLTGMHALETLAAKSTGTVVGCCAALAEGDAAKRTDIFFLEPLPLFAH